MALTDGLVSYWSLDEASGTRADSHGSNTLADNNTVTSATGKVDDCADFTATNSEYLSIPAASQTGLDSTGDMSIAGCINFDVLPTATAYCLGQKYGTASNSSWIAQMRKDASYGLRFYNSDDGSALGYHTISLDTLSTSTWYHIVVAYDASAGSIEVWQNGTSKGSGTGSLKTSIYNGTSPFEMGRWGGANYLDGREDEVAIWNRLITNTEVGELYNSGNGTSYADLSPVSGPPATLKTWNTVVPSA